MECEHSWGIGERWMEAVDAEFLKRVSFVALQTTTSGLMFVIMDSSKQGGQDNDRSNFR